MDIFDKIMAHRIFRPLWPFWQKQREKLLYLFFGGLTTLVSIAAFWLFSGPVGLDELIANVFSWLLAVCFAYVTNARWVFTSRPADGREALSRMLSFTAGRLATLGIEELILLVFVTWLGLGAMPVKIAAQVIVIVLNYVISKWIVFRKKKGTGGE